MSDVTNLIVIIEDDPGLRQALQRLLRLSGFGTQSFESAEEPDVFDCASYAQCVVIDVQLPGISGPTFYESLSMPRPPVVFITAFDNAATRDAIARTGTHIVLTKPFLGKALLDAIGVATHSSP